MTDYQGNSHKSKNEVPPEIKAQKVVQGAVVKQKVPLTRKLKDMFFVTDSRTVGNYILWEVLGPKLKHLLYETWTLGVGKALGEGPSHLNQFGNPGPQSVHVNYQRASAPRPVDPRTGFARPLQQPSPISLQGPRTSQEYLFQTRTDAENVLELMLEILMVHGVVTVADVQQMASLPIAHTDHKLGWTHLGHAAVEQTRQGYILKLPPVIAV